MVFEKVAKILSELMEADQEDITPETALSKDTGMDALMLAKLVIQSEKKFKIKIHDEDVHAFQCVDDIVKYIERAQP